MNEQPLHPCLERREKLRSVRGVCVCVYVGTMVISRWTRILAPDQKGSSLKLSPAPHPQTPQRIKQGWFDHQLGALCVWSKKQAGRF